MWTLSVVRQLGQLGVGVGQLAVGWPISSALFFGSSLEVESACPLALETGAGHTEKGNALLIRPFPFTVRPMALATGSQKQSRAACVLCTIRLYQTEHVQRTRTTN